MPQTRRTESRKLRVQLRNESANLTIGSFAAVKALAVAVNPIPVADVIGGSAVDATMVVTLAHIYGLEMSWAHAKGLARSILKAAGWMVAAELAVDVASGLFKGLTLGAGTVLTAIPQGAAAGYGSYIVGPGGEVLLRARGVVGRRSAQDGDPPHPRPDRSQVGARRSERRDQEEAHSKLARRVVAFCPSLAQCSRIGSRTEPHGT